MVVWLSYLCACFVRLFVRSVVRLFVHAFARFFVRLHVRSVLCSLVRWFVGLLFPLHFVWQHFFRSILVTIQA